MAHRIDRIAQLGRDGCPRLLDELVAIEHFQPWVRTWRESGRSEVAPGADEGEEIRRGGRATTVPATAQSTGAEEDGGKAELHVLLWNGSRGMERGRRKRMGNHGDGRTVAVAGAARAAGAKEDKEEAELLSLLGSGSRRRMGRELGLIGEDRAEGWLLALWRTWARGAAWRQQREIRRSATEEEMAGRARRHQQWRGDDDFGVEQRSRGARWRAS